MGWERALFHQHMGRCHYSAEYCLSWQELKVQLPAAEDAKESKPTENKAPAEKAEEDADSASQEETAEDIQTPKPPLKKVCMF